VGLRALLVAVRGILAKNTCKDVYLGQLHAKSDKNKTGQINSASFKTFTINTLEQEFLNFFAVTPLNNV
jgi:hypothetical protein